MKYEVIALIDVPFISDVGEIARLMKQWWPSCDIEIKPILDKDEE